MMLPFLKRHVALINPDLIVLMGNTACQAVLGRKGITRLRGNWTSAFECPVMPMYHPAALLRDGSKKAGAWADLLSIQARLKE
jgi:DNA polymerase